MSQKVSRAEFLLGSHQTYPLSGDGCGDLQMGIALSIEPLCHFDCFDDNQCIAGVIPLQLGINFPVDPLGFRRQLFFAFWGGG